MNAARLKVLLPPVILLGGCALLEPMEDPTSSRLDELERRMQAKKQKNWADADAIRDQLKAAGVVLEDGAGGTSWRRG